MTWRAIKVSSDKLICQPNFEKDNIINNRNRPHGTSFHVARGVSRFVIENKTMSSWNQLCQPGRVSSLPNVQQWKWVWVAETVLELLTGGAYLFGDEMAFIPKQLSRPAVLKFFKLTTHFWLS